MITGPRRQFEARCFQRGYTIAQVRECIVSEDGDTITVDETHPAYPRQPAKAAVAAPPPPPASGPGTELKKLLGRFGIKSTPNCSCNARAAQMDVWGPDECERRLDEIVDWLGEEAQRRKRLFSRLVAAQVVKLAIRRARHAAS